jgi:Mrr N-terminal domain
MIINPGQHDTLIGIDHEVLEALKLRAEPLVDDPNTVLHRELQIGATSNGHRPRTPLVLEEAREVSRAAEGRKPSAGKRAKAPATKRPRIGKSPRASKGSLTPEEAFEDPLLRILEKAGGQLPVRDVLAQLRIEMSSRLNDEDRVEDGKGVARWEKRVHFVRLKLVDRGLLSRDVARGTWAITDMGRERVAVAS